MSSLLHLTVAAAVSAGLSAVPDVPERPLGGAGSWSLVFNEDFAGPLDPEKWMTCYWWDDGGCTNLGTGELQWYLPENVTVADDTLELTAREELVTGHEGREFEYTSGIVTTGRSYEERDGQDRFSFTYGFIEIRARLPIGQGLWSAAWLLPSDHESKPEIDLFEVLGHQPDVLEMRFHYSSARQFGESSVIPGLAAGWQTYGLDWSPDAIVWYVNGIEQWRFDRRERIPDEPMYLLLNLAVGGEWPGYPDETTTFPSSLLIDYVRIWQRAEE